MAEPKTNLRVKISADLAQFQQGLSTVQKSVKGLGGMLAGALAGVSVGAIFGAILRSTIESEQAIAKLNATIKSTGGAAGLSADQLSEMASGLQAVTTYGDEAIMGAQDILLTFTKIGRDVFPRATEAVLDLSTKFGTDLSSSAMQLGKALNDPIKGITALSRAGVQFTDQQKASIKTFVETGRVLDAQKVILAELETQVGGSARAMRDTLGGSFTALKEAAGDLLEGDSGSEGLRGIKDSLQSLTAQLQDPRTKEGFATLTSAMLKLGSVAAEAVVEFAEFGRQLGFVAAKIAGNTAPLDEVEQEIKDVDRALKNSFMGKPTKYLFTSEDELERIRRRLVAEREALLAASGFAAAPRVNVETGRTSTPGKGRWANINQPAVAPAEGDSDKKAAASARERAAAKRELTEAEKAYQDVAETNAMIDQLVADAETERVIREGELLAAKERGIAATQQQISDMEFEASLIGLTNTERAKAIALRYADAEATDAQRQRLVEMIEETERLKQIEETRALLTEGMTGFFHSIITGAASAKDAFKSFVESVLDGIARIVAEQLALAAVKMMLSMLPGGGVLAAVMHKGGIVGAAGAVRDGLNPLMFGAAPRYHSGGFAGLASNEVPAVLERGEEVLTEDDPRHAKNLKKGRAGGNTYVTVENHSGVSAKVEEGSRGSDDFVRVIIGVAAADVGKNGALGKAIGQRFGLQPAGVARG